MNMHIQHCEHLVLLTLSGLRLQACSRTWPMLSQAGNGKSEATAATSGTANGAKPAAKKTAGKAKP